MIAIEKRNSALTKLLLEAKIDANTLNNVSIYWYTNAIVYYVFYK